MHDPSRTVPIWLILPYLSLLERLFLLALMLLSIYVLFSAVTTLWRTRKTVRSFHAGNTSDRTEFFIRIRKRSVRVDRLITTALHLFGFVLFSGLVDSYITIDNSSTPGGWLVLRNFAPHFAFASNVFFALVVLHVIGWFNSSCLDRFSLEDVEAATSIGEKSRSQSS
jgi:hypothetical protein